MAVREAEVQRAAAVVRSASIGLEAEALRALTVAKGQIQSDVEEVINTVRQREVDQAESERAMQAACDEKAKKVNEQLAALKREKEETVWKDAPPSP